ncbi:hypothetical protein [Paenarthrobacter nitroguajacolicus]|uniref:hypothetical protein n=1 Tax=Paenarthrobacter nitroguajacolicus TaxID=211146 RepID=UPI0028646A5A|nr:hypothetical protein [Paenarthrobacter nitroguajacolicus]MDR6637132.1 hypothetical protein [Paenarthrobacter nitroguajacolicus]
MHEQEQPPAPEEPAQAFADLAVFAPVLARKLTHLPPELLEAIFPPENSVGPL